MKSKLLRFWPILIILGLVVAFAFPWWLKGKVPFPADYLVDTFPPWQYYYGHPVKNNAMPDVVTQMYPWKRLVIGLWKKGQIPLWNPFNFSGNPLLANYQSAVFHPANSFFFILPEIDAWSLMILIQPLLAAIFTYLFCRQRQLSQGASLLAAISFMFCGFMTCWLAYGTLSYALLWLPLVLYAIEKKFYPLASLALAASFFSGHFQTSLYVLLASFGYLIWRKKFVLSLVFAFLGVGLAAVQILPAFELHQLSPRSQFFTSSEQIPWQHMLTILAPDFYGNPVTRNVRGHYAEWTGFVGVIPFVLAVFAAWRQKQGRFFALLAAMALLLALPTPIFDLIVKLKIPVLATSAASRIIGIFSFAAAVLAGFGFDQLYRDLKTKKVKPILQLVGVMMALFLGIWLILLFIKPFAPVDLAVSKRNFILPTAMIFAFGGLMVAARLFQQNLKFVILALVLILSFFDLFRFAQKWMPFASKDYVYPSLPILEFLTEKVGSDRVFGNFGMEMQNYYQIPGFNGYDPMYLRRYGELLMAADDGKIKKPPMRGVDLSKRSQHTISLLNLLGAKYILHAVPDDHYVWAFPFWEYPEQFKQIYQDGMYEVYENMDVFPRAFMAYDYQVVKESQGVIDQMFAARTNLEKTIILEEEPQLAATGQLSNPAEVKIVDYSPNQIKVEVQTEKTGLLFLSDNYYPGWQARVSGQPAKIYRANYSFRAVPVPEGRHKIEFIYKPKSFQLGFILSIFSLAAVIAFSLLGKRSSADV